MKKFLVLVLVLVATVVNAATGEWKKTVLEADELKGESGGTAYTYDVPGMGSFVFWGFDEFQYRLVSEKMFNTEITSGKYTSSYNGIIVLVGLYDDNGKLCDKFNMWLDKEENKGFRFVRTRDQGGMFNPVGQKSKVKKIFKHLKSGKGYVRIVCERYETTDFDLKITPFNL